MSWTGLFRTGDKICYWNHKNQHRQVGAENSSRRSSRHVSNLLLRQPQLYLQHLHQETQGWEAGVDSSVRYPGWRSDLDSLHHPSDWLLPEDTRYSEDLALCVHLCQVIFPSFLHSKQDFQRSKCNQLTS